MTIKYDTIINIRSQKVVIKNTLIKDKLVRYGVLVVMTAFGFIVSLLLFFPGFRSPDSEWQLCQAIGSCELDTWHPIAMSLLWGFLIKISGGVVSSMLFLQLLMLWLGLFLVGLYVLRSTGNKFLAISVLLIGFLPNIMNISGVIWKDIQMASSLILAVGILLNLKGRKTLTRAIGVALSLALMTYAVSVRSNAIFAVLPIVLFLMFSLEYPKKSLYKALIGVAILVIMATATPLLNHLIKPTRSSASFSMYAYDIVNILPKDQLATKAPQNIKSQLLMLSDCSLFSNESTQLAFWTCIDRSNWEFLAREGLGDLKRLWLDVVVSHPLAYLAQKVETYTQFVFSGDGQPIWNGGGEVFLGDDVRSRSDRPISLSTRSINHSYTVNFGYKYFPFIYKAWFWMLLSSLLIIVARRLKAHKLLVYCLVSSSLLYILSYSVGSLTSDYRYIYWSVIASLVSVVLVSSSLTSHKVKKEKLL